jgi:hypothetical protein
MEDLLVEDMVAVLGAVFQVVLLVGVLVDLVVVVLAVGVPVAIGSIVSLFK